MGEGIFCYGCMTPLEGTKRFCPYCGFNYQNYMDRRNENSLLPGTVLADKYLLGRVMGAGGFGITYLGYDLKLERKVAIKEYFPTANASRSRIGTEEFPTTVRPTGSTGAFEKGLENFLGEAKTLAGLGKAERKAVVTVIDFFNANGTGYMVMEYLPGPTLKTIVKSGKEIMTQQKVISLLEPVLNSLALIHEQGLIHRDISPDNLMMDDAGKLILIDFGASRSMETSKSMTVVLKQGFAPYEQYTREGSQGAWTDIYAICATIYYMFTGAVPQRATDRILNDRMRSLKELGMPVSREFSEAVKKGMSVSPEDRFKTMTDLKNALVNAMSPEEERKKEERILSRGRNYAFEQEIRHGDTHTGHGQMDNQIRPEGPNHMGPGGFADRSGHGGGRVPTDPGNSSGTDVGRIALYIAVSVICVAIILVSLIWLKNSGEDEREVAATQSSSQGTTQSSSQATTQPSSQATAQSSSQATTQPSGEATTQSLSPDEVDGSQPTYLTGKYEEEHVIQIYTEPSESSAKVKYGDGTSLPESVLVARLAKEGNFSKVYYAGIVGWVESNKLSHFSDQAKYIWPGNVDKKVFTFQEISLHEEASSGSSLEPYKLSYGTELTIKEVKNGFGRVRYKKKDCWVDMHYVRLYSKKGRKWRIDKAAKGQDGTYLYKHRREKKSERLKELKDGKKITIKKFKNGWGKATVGGKTGWVKVKNCVPLP